MKTYLAFSKKEWLDYFRNYKILILVIVFAILGIMSPLTAKFMPDLMKAIMPPNVNIQLAKPSNLDSWQQFFKNISQTGIIVIVIIFSTMMSHEYEKGTFINMVTKGLSRRIIILAKYNVALMIWSACYALSFLITFLYTLYYFPHGQSVHLFLAVFSLYFYGILLISVLVFGSAAFRSLYGPLLLTGGFAVLLVILNLFPKMEKWNPLQLENSDLKMLTGGLRFHDVQFSYLVSALIILLALELSIQVFNKKIL